MYSCYNGVYDFGACECSNNFATFTLEYWERSLFQRLRTLFKFDGLPKAAPGQVGWDLDAFLYGLYRMGYLVVFETKKYGVVPPQPATPYGYGLQMQPTGMMVQTPYFSFDRALTIGTECEVIKLTPDYRGVWDIISKYATELMYMDTAIRMSQINARFAYVIAASDQKTAKSVKGIMEQLQNAQPAIVYDAKLRTRIGEADDATAMPWQQFDRDLKQNFILPELLEARRTSLTDFYREIGVVIMPDKKERMISTEAESYSAETYNRKQVWNICLQESLEKVNAMFGLHLTAEFIEPEPPKGDDTDDSRKDSTGTESRS